MSLWERISHHHTESPSDVPPAHLERDPDLDMVHIQQHDLINKVTAKHLRESMRLRALGDQVDVYQRTTRREEP